MFKSHVVVPPNDMHVLWQVPQYIIVTAGEVSHEFSIQIQIPEIINNFYFYFSIRSCSL